MHLVMLIKNAAENANWNERETLTDKERKQKTEKKDVSSCQTKTKIFSNIHLFTSRS